MLKPSTRTIVFGVLIGFTLLYLNTAVVTGGGGFVVRFVYKPFHGIYPFYNPGSGEEHAWRALAESPNPPWWITGDYVLILTDSSEGNDGILRPLYTRGYYATWAGWFYVLLILMITLVRGLIKQFSRRNLS
jgi:hypothetical protein